MPGVAAPPTFENNISFRKPNEKRITKNDLIENTQRQSQIDTLPRHTAGSAKVIESIANIKENQSRKENEEDEEDSVVNVPIYNRRSNKSYKTDSLKATSVEENKTNLSSKNVLSEILQELSSKKKPESKQSTADNNNRIVNIPNLTSLQSNNKTNASMTTTTTTTNNNKAKFHNILKSHQIPSITDNENQVERHRFQRQQQQQKHLSNSKHNLANSSLLIQLNNQSSSTSQSLNENLKVNHLQIDSTTNLKKLNKKRQKVYNNLVSLNKIEKNQKAKILEQERLLKIQNMKLQDALIIQKSLINFDGYSKHDEDYTIYDGMEKERYRKFEKKHATSKSTVKPPIYKRRLPATMKFPSIVTKYEPRQSMESISAPRSSHYSSNLSHYKPRRSTSMIFDNSLYLETTEEIVDATGRILSKNQSCRYLGESTNNSQIDFEKPYRPYSPEIEINNHKYELISSNKKLAASELKAEELTNIINLIKEIDKNEVIKDYKQNTSVYGLNEKLDKRSKSQTPGIFDRLNEDDRLYKTNSINDIKQPSFTIPENIYKSVVSKRMLKSQSLKDYSQFTVNSEGNPCMYFKAISPPHADEDMAAGRHPKKFIVSDNIYEIHKNKNINIGDNNKLHASEFIAEF